MIALATSRVGIAAVALIVGFLYGHYVAGRGEAVRTLRATIESLRLDLAVSEASSKEAAKQAASLRNLKTELEGRLDAYAAELSARNNVDACRLSDDDINSLRGVQK